MSRLIGLRGRLLATYLLVVTFGLSVFVIRYGWIAQDGIVEELEHEEELRAFILSNALEEPVQAYTSGELSLDDLKPHIDRLAASAEGRLTLLDSQGVPLYDTQADAAAIPNQWQQVEVQAALTEREEHDIRPDPITGDERLYVAAPIAHEGNVLGVVQLSIPTTEMWAEIRQTWLSLLATSLVVVIATVLVSLWLAKGILEPVRALRQAAVSMAAGDLDQRISTDGSDELGRLGQAFNRMAERLQHMIIQQRDFVANASHELRTPLTTIKLRIEALHGGARHDPTITDRFLLEIEDEINRLNHLIDNLLALSDAEAGLDTWKMERLDLQLLLSESVAAFSPRAQSVGITLTMDISPQLPDVRASAPQLRQVLDNLLDNALKYSSPGGVITLLGRPGKEGVVVSVTDTGQGIPANDLSRVFDRFYRVDKARSRQEGPAGTGLGLSIVRSIIEAHDGTVSIDSLEGKGTSVRFTLPAYPDAQSDH
ncbi:MAG: HAMP domain-containing protein [Anaerolineales bacterium]|nr:MAG: HAMP domain-containing protein [Anaerolineales bacterium]